MTTALFQFDHFPELETERLRLRRITPDDLQDWLTIFNHPDVIRYLVDFNDWMTDLGEVQGIIRWSEDVFAQKNDIRWAITLKPDARMIGTCGFHLYSPVNRSADIGYELNHDYWRCGIMREAITAVLDFLFDSLNLHRVAADVAAGNEASAGLLRSLGFTQEGTWREKVFARGQFYDLWQFGLLAREYPR